MIRTLALVCLGLLWSTVNAQDLTITNARIIDGNGGVIADGSVVIRDGRIASVSAGSASASGRNIDARGMTVMPGFTDAHRHVILGADPDRWVEEEAPANMREYLEAGFTTILSAGDPLEAILELRRRLADGEIAGPRLIAAGRVPLARSAGGMAGGPPGDPARASAGRPLVRPTEPAEAIPEDETRAAVRRLAQAGVDAIKTVIFVSPGGPEQGTLAVVAEEAARHGIPSITHATTVQDTVAAVRAGTHVLVHTPHVDQLDTETARMIAESGIPMMSTLGVWVPTFAADNTYIRAKTGEDNVARFRDLEPFPMSALLSAGLGSVNARLLWDAGITYGYGTDTRFLPRDSLVHELKPLRLVFSAQDIVTMLTRNAAVAVGLSDEIGTLEPGKVADIVIVQGNPLADVDALLDVRIVVKGGRVVVEKR